MVNHGAESGFFYACLIRDSEGLWEEKKTGLTITEGQVQIGEKQIIRNMKALNAEEAKTGDIPGTAGPPEVIRESAVLFPDYTADKRRWTVSGTRRPCQTYQEYVIA